MAGTSVSGVGSGIDTAAIVKALVNSEKAPKQAQINTQTLNATTTLSAVGAIKSALDAYRTALGTLNTETAFKGLAASSSSESVVKATADGTAFNGSYALDVEQLATSSKVSSKVFAGGASAVVGGGSPTTLKITQSGTNYDVVVPANATLQQVRDSINTQLQSKGISANLLTDANGSRLVLGSTTTGAGSEITLGGDSGIDTGYTTVTTPQNAKYSIDSIKMESKTNSVSSAVSGLNLALVGAGKSTVTVATSSSSLKTSVQSFVDAYNGLLTAINKQTKVSTSGDAATRGALTGDATMRHLVSSIRNELVQSTSGGLSLSQLGINTEQKTGLLSFDTTKWEKAVSSNASAIAGLFTGEDGLLSRMTSATDAYAQTGGILASRTTNLNETLENLTQQQKALERRVESLTVSLSAKYTAMDTLVARLNATSSSIMTTLNALNNPKSD